MATPSASSEVVKDANFAKLGTEATMVNKFITTLFSSLSEFQRLEQILTTEYFAHYDRFQNQVEIITKNEKKYVVRCDKDSIYRCFSAEYIVDKNLPVALSPKDRTLAQAAPFFRHWVSECRKLTLRTH